jgi:ABC-type lipoprotein release transport system permease subunit
MQRLGLYLRLAWRNLWRHKRRTIIMLLAIMIGVWMMLVTSAFATGMVGQQLDDAVKNLTGHIQIHHPKYRDDPVIAHSMRFNYEELEKRLQVTGIDHWGMRVRLPAIVNSERESAGIILLGVEPNKERGLSFIPDSITMGRYLADSDEPGIIIGAKLAEKLETGIGKRIVLMSQGADNNLADRGFRIIGLYRSEFTANEMAYAFTGLHTAQSMLRMDDQISEIAIVIKDQGQLETITQDLSSLFPLHEVVNWRTVLAIMVASIEIYDSYMILWYLIVFFAMSFGIVNTILISVYERTRELGLFQALGMRPKDVLVHILMEAMSLLLVGLAIGNVLIILTLLYFSNGIDMTAFSRGMDAWQLGSIVYLSIDLNDFLTVNLLVLILGLITSLYPARRAAKMQPVEAITRG